MRIFFEVDSDGLRPTFFRRNINVAPTAVDFTYPDLVRAGGDLVSGGAMAKSNDASANNIIDGDLNTFLGAGHAGQILRVV